MNRIDETRPFIPLRIAVLTVSDTRTQKTDKSGPLLAQFIEDAGHVLADRQVVEDDEKSIRKQVKKWIKDKEIDAVITTGGTGFTGRDVTPEAVRPLFEKEIEGFSTIFHMLSYQTFIFCLPGSPGACEDAWKGILVHQFDNRHRPCSFIEVMPRLGETKKKKAE